MITPHQFDRHFGKHFAKLHQVFMYITDVCNLRCVQCIYKPNVIFNNGREIPENTALSLLASFRQLGASKLTLLGGEPTLYGARDDHRPLKRVIRGARDLGYEYIRIDTNGTFPDALLDDSDFRTLNEIAFSVDGYTAEMNDSIRGQNTFTNSLYRMKLAKRLGFKVTITCCVHKQLVKPIASTGYELEKMIRFAEEAGIDQINFHDLFKAGVPMDTWTGDLNHTVAEWIPVYEDIRSKINQKAFKISVRLPQCFITKEEFQSNPEYYGYCPVKLGERVMVHPDGVIRICSNLICSEHFTAKYAGGQIAWNETETNEMLHHELDKMTPCTNRSLNRSYGKYVPLCFSFKPDQDEFVYHEKLAWETRRAERNIETEVH